ncbi:undecaprenyl-diphosphatase [Tistlia consotensis]|uniref:Undecaprenyl-diphosphatase n=1 Tax=Tistlia consotensis USBA 355 TaxID=560819 RepID=A0A1Y6B9J0_9PROT|nr:undecaprenyl-diphosphate phosphatase [Tistlia consotensis]SME91711.1 undecaprenyl-diphosphatase [Tistlia consotensis USBA 355]SNR27583.1 undecaprenyl-diphosphatase [Tistlia consotensis]
MTLLQALAVAALQGITELFPVSSLGHAVVLPALLGWSLDRQGGSFLPFLVVLHLGTATALLVFFRRDWVALVGALLGFGEPEERAERRRLIGLMVVATLPAVVVGFALEKTFRELFATPVVAAAFLVVNGAVLFGGERLRRRSSHGELSSLTWKGALAIGLWQCTALIPGISRSGATILGGLLAGLHHKASARFSFLIATPIIFAAGVLEVPKLLHQSSAALDATVWLAGAVAAVCAYASTAFLMRYFGERDLDALDPFAWYCMALGAVALGVFLI